MNVPDFTIQRLGLRRLAAAFLTTIMHVLFNHGSARAGQGPAANSVDVTMWLIRRGGAPISSAPEGRKIIIHKTVQRQRKT